MLLLYSLYAMTNVIHPYTIQLLQAEAQRVEQQQRAEQAEARAAAQAEECEHQRRQHSQARARDQERSRAALERERTRRKEERELRERAEVSLATAEEKRVADLRQQDAELRSNNQVTHERAKEATRLEKKLAKAEAKIGKRFVALEAEREKRREAEAQAMAEQERAVAAARARDANLRSSNERLQQLVRNTAERVLHLQHELQKAQQQEQVQVAARLERELGEAQRKLSTANKSNASLRQRVAASGVTRAEEQLRAANKKIQALEEDITRREQVMKELELEEDKAIAAEKEERKRASRTHAQALRRGRAKTVVVRGMRKEVKKSAAEIVALTAQLQRATRKLVEQQQTANARYDELMARVEAGESRNAAVLSELAAAGEVAKAEAKRAALQHSRTMEELAGAKEALKAYQDFQAKEGGRYKESVRMCYYQLIDLKVPTNQLEGVVQAVLGMVGSKATALPKRSSAQNMRREMGHWADVVAGVELATAHHVTGASDDTTKRQRTLAADLTHHMMPDGTRRTLCIGLSCMSRGTAASKAEHFEQRMKDVQAAAKLSVPDMHGTVGAFDRVTLGHLVTAWNCDRAITERNAAEQIEERKAAEVRVCEGARQLRALNEGAEGSSAFKVSLELRLKGGASLTLESQQPALEASSADAETLELLRFRAEMHLEGEDGAAMETMAPAMKEQMIGADCARMLGSEWWDGLSEEKQRELKVVHVATCNAHRWVNVGKGLDEGIKKAFKEIKGGEGGEPTAKDGGAPWDRLIYETAKLVCMNARKMNVAIGQDLLGYQMIELGKSPEDCLHTKIKVRNLSSSCGQPAITSGLPTTHYWASGNLHRGGRPAGLKREGMPGMPGPSLRAFLPGPSLRACHCLKPAIITS